MSLLLFLIFIAACIGDRPVWYIGYSFFCFYVCLLFEIHLLINEEEDL